MVDGYLSRLPEPPETANGLVVLLERVRREHRGMRAMLPVEPPCPNYWFGYQNADRAARERLELLDLRLVAVLAAHLNGVGHELGKKVALVV